MPDVTSMTWFAAGQASITASRMPVSEREPWLDRQRDRLTETVPLLLLDPAALNEAFDFAKSVATDA